MEFGATVCTPKLAKCDTCIFNTSCYALANKQISVLPFKKGKTKVRKRYFNYLVFLDENNNTQIKKRQGKGIWEGLYEFPLIETEKSINKDELIALLAAKNSSESCVLYNEEPIIHKLSHQHLYCQFWIIKTKHLIENKTPWELLENYPFPILIRNFIKKQRPNKNN